MWWFYWDIVTSLSNKYPHLVRKACIIARALPIPRFSSIFAECLHLNFISENTARHTHATYSLACSSNMICDFVPLFFGCFCFKLWGTCFLFCFPMLFDIKLTGSCAFRFTQFIGCPKNLNCCRVTPIWQTQMSPSSYASPFHDLKGLWVLILLFICKNCKLKFDKSIMHEPTAFRFTNAKICHGSVKMYVHLSSYGLCTHL